MKSIEEQAKIYCKKYNVPLQYLFEILEDQKVVPMIRGKASEYNATLFLQEYFKERSIEWVVTKLNLNPQSDMNDEDLTIIHRKTGTHIKVEVKNAVRDSFKDGKRCRDLKVPQFSVKCHKSRSNISKADSTNDRYLIGEFDLVMSNTSNAIILGGKKTLEDFKITDNESDLKILFDYYKVSTKEDLLDMCYNDWRFAVPEEIAEEDGSIPRTPKVILDETKEPKWFKVERLEEKLLEIVERKLKDWKRK